MVTSGKGLSQDAEQAAFLGDRIGRILGMLSRVDLLRNLALLDRRLTPDLYTLVMATKQVAGDSFAMHVAEQARSYEGGGGLFRRPRLRQRRHHEVPSSSRISCPSE